MDLVTILPTHFSPYINTTEERGRHGCLELGESEVIVEGLENLLFIFSFIESQHVSNLITVRCQVD